MSQRAGSRNEQSIDLRVKKWQN